MNDDTITLIIMELKLFYISRSFISIFSQNLIKTIIEVILVPLLAESFKLWKTTANS